MKKVIMFFLCGVAAHSVYTLSESENREMQLMSENAEALAIVPVEKTCYDTVTDAEGIQTLYCRGCQWIEGKPGFFASTGKCVPGDK